VTSVRQGGKHVVGVVFGGATGGSRDATMRVALTRALLKASPVKTRKSGPQLIARARVAPAPVTVAAPVAVAAAPAITSAPAPAPLAVAKVRPVMVAARPRPPEPPAPAVAPAPPPPSVMQQVAGVVSAPGRGAPPSSFQAQARNLSGGDAPATASPTISSAANTELPRKAKPGFMQAGNNPPYRLGGAVPTDDEAPEPIAVSTAPASVTAPLVVGTNTGFHVQIGAYATAAESERMLASVKDKAPGAVAGSTQLTSPVNKDNRKLYRARFAGFDARGAAKACQSLRQQSIDCFVMKAE
jgi:D-alanyl-D-alanine carboxypeptidase